MARIRVYLNEEQERWVQRVSRELDQSEAEVIRRVVDIQREERDHIAGAASVDSTETTTGHAADGPARGAGPDDLPPDGRGGRGSAPADPGESDGPTKDELLERIGELEDRLEEERTDDDEDEAMGWR